MNIEIGLENTPRPLELELKDGTDAKKLSKEVESSIKNSDVSLTLTDKDNNQIVINASKIVYFKIGNDSAERKVGFGV